MFRDEVAYHDTEEKPVTDVNMIQMIDIRDPVDAEVILSEDRKTMWVNVDGICRLRLVGMDSGFYIEIPGVGNITQNEKGECEVEAAVDEQAAA